MPAYDPKSLPKLPPPPKKVQYSDAEVANLKLNHMPSGSKIFLWRGFWDGIQRDISLGSFPAVSIFNARKRGRDINTLRAGGASYAEYEAANDRGAKVAANTNVAAAVTNDDDLAGLPRIAVHPRGVAVPAAVVADGKTCDWIFDLYMKREGNSRDSGPEKRRMYNRDLKAAIGQKSIFEVTHEDFADILAIKAGHAPIQSNNLQSLIRRWFRWACTLGRAETGMRSQINPTADLIKLAKPRSRERFFDDYEIALFLRAIDVKATVMNDGWRLCLLTGVRRDEAFAAPFVEFNLELNEWLIPKERTKTDAELLLPLPLQAMAIVKRATEAKRRESQRLMWPSAGTHMQNRGADVLEHPRSGFSKAVKAIHSTMEAIAACDPQRPAGFTLKSWSTHDLRRTMASGMNGLMGPGYEPLIDPEIVERILNHKIPGIRGTYNRWQYLREKKHALALWADHLDSVQQKFMERLSRYQPKG